VAHTLVAVDKGMIGNQGKRERDSLFFKIPIEITTGKTEPRLCDGRFQGSEIPKLPRTTGLLDYPPMELQDLSEREVPQGSLLTEALVEITVLLKHVGRNLLKVRLWLSKKVSNRGSCEFLNRDVEPGRRFFELLPLAITDSY